MTVIRRIYIPYLLLLLLVPLRFLGQEREGHLNCNPTLFDKQPPRKLLNKGTATSTDPLPLPFFEDFAYDGVFPDSSKWTDYQVYVNNTMGNKPVSRGVATFDALDWRGIPYDSFSNSTFRYADTLTSQPINLSLNVVTPADSVYLSFFYQPQGNGFYPLPQDSLMLYLKTKFGGFVKIWSAPGTTIQPFTQVMIPLSDSLYFDSFFQFRFVNIAALQWADADWNIDYIRVNSGRNMYDTTLGDVGFTYDPTFLLNDYTSMPYRQFTIATATERVTQLTCNIRNNYDAAQPVTYGYNATVLNTSTILKTHSWNSGMISPQTTQPFTVPAYTTLIPLSSVGEYARVVFRNQFVIQSVSPSDPPQNDTIVRDQVFDNYLAYDDGSAEKSYYLDLDPSLPGKLAIEYHLNKPDTMRGMAIYFGRQVPLATYKYFNILVYNSISGVNGSIADHVLYTQEFCYPGYADTLNHFWIYRFDDPLPLPAGTFFAGTLQPAEGGSDSLYFGLDVNRIGSNHTYYSVLSHWQPSLIGGAVMMRPIFGLPIFGTEVNSVSSKPKTWSISPNPSSDYVHFRFESDAPTAYSVLDMQGRVILEGKVENEGRVWIGDLAPGLYIVKLAAENLNYQPLKFYKQ